MRSLCRTTFYCREFIPGAYLRFPSLGGVSCATLEIRILHLFQARLNIPSSERLWQVNTCTYRHSVLLVNRVWSDPGRSKLALNRRTVQLRMSSLHQADSDPDFFNRRTQGAKSPLSFTVWACLQIARNDLSTWFLPILLWITLPVSIVRKSFWPVQSGSMPRGYHRSPSRSTTYHLVLASCCSVSLRDGDVLGGAWVLLSRSFLLQLRSSRWSAWSLFLSRRSRLSAGSMRLTRRSRGGVASVALISSSR